MASPKQRRFFIKRESREVPALNSVKNERAFADLPHNSRLIPAYVYRSFLIVLYGSILFSCLVLVYFTSIKNPHYGSGPVTSLIHYPASADSHLNYARWLVSRYRLADAASELQFIRSSQRRGFLAGLDETSYSIIQKEITTRELVFHSILSEYSFLLKNQINYPDYRDGLYRTSQLSYMLYNPLDSRTLLERCIELDPHFTQGRTALKSLQSEL